MAITEHVELLNQGVAAWNTWRVANRGVVPNLSGTAFHERRLQGIDLSNSVLDHAHFNDCDLSGANLIAAYLFCASFLRTKLHSADLRDANLSCCWLAEAELERATLWGTNFNSAALTKANLKGARLGQTILTDVDLSKVRGLEFTEHGGASSIGIDTLYKSQGKIPDEFLHATGQPREAIDLAQTLRAGPPIQWQSCFISYSHKDEEFARQLCDRMRKAGLRVWYAAEDMQGGKKLHEQIYNAIQIHDRLLLVLSEHSIQSEWVMTEIRKARETEKKEKRRKLFPIRLANFETLRDWTCFDGDTGKDLAVEVREYFIPDFSNWKDHAAFEAAFARLQKDLKEDSQSRSAR